MKNAPGKSLKKNVWSTKEIGFIEIVTIDFGDGDRRVHFNKIDSCNFALHFFVTDIVFAYGGNRNTSNPTNTVAEAQSEDDVVFPTLKMFSFHRTIFTP